MIDWEKTTKINKMWKYELRDEFALNQSSNKLVALDCKKCGEEIVKPFKKLYSPYCANCETKYDIIEYGNRLIAERNIAWNQTARLQGTDVQTAVAYFITHPHSNKKVMIICRNCGKMRIVQFKNYHHLCNSCSKKVNVDKNKEIYSLLQNELLNSTQHNIDWVVSASGKGKSVKEFMLYLRNTRPISRFMVYYITDTNKRTNFDIYYKTYILDKLNEIMR